MAKIEDILQLKEAGFTADEITNLLGVITHEEDKKEEPKQVEPANDFKGDKLYDRIGELIAKIEANAIGNSTITKSENSNAEDILAKIVNPK